LRRNSFLKNNIEEKWKRREDEEEYSSSYWRTVGNENIEEAER
jgi:hypothetical protein